MYSVSIVKKLDSMSEKKSQIYKLIAQEWTDKSIAGYLGTDHKTISRYRIAFKQLGPDVTTEQVIQLTIAQVQRSRSNHATSATGKRMS